MSEPTTDKYEYTAQWYSDGSDSWIPSGWRGSSWGGLNKAVKDKEEGVRNFSRDMKWRIVRRIKAGPIEEYDPTTDKVLNNLRAQGFSDEQIIDLGESLLQMLRGENG